MPVERNRLSFFSHFGKESFSNLTCMTIGYIVKKSEFIVWTCLYKKISWSELLKVWHNWDLKLYNWFCYNVNHNLLQNHVPNIDKSILSLKMQEIVKHLNCLLLAILVKSFSFFLLKIAVKNIIFSENKGCYFLKVLNILQKGHTSNSMIGSMLMIPKLNWCSSFSRSAFEAMWEFSG